MMNHPYNVSSSPLFNVEKDHWAVRQEVARADKKGKPGSESPKSATVSFKKKRTTINYQEHFGIKYRLYYRFLT